MVWISVRIPIYNDLVADVKLERTKRLDTVLTWSNLDNATKGDLAVSVILCLPSVQCFHPISLKLKLPINYLARWNRYYWPLLLQIWTISSMFSPGPSVRCSQHLTNNGLMINAYKQSHCRFFVQIYSKVHWTMPWTWSRSSSVHNHHIGNVYRTNIGFEHSDPIFKGA